MRWNYKGDGKGFQGTWWWKGGWWPKGNWHWEGKHIRWPEEKRHWGDIEHDWWIQGWWPADWHGKGFKGKHGKDGKGKKDGGWHYARDALSSYTSDVLVAEKCLGYGVGGVCFCGTYKSESGPVSVAIKPAHNWCETEVLARIQHSDPSLPCVIPVLCVRHPTPGGDVNVVALASHGTLGDLLAARSWTGLEATVFLAIVANVADGLEALHSKGIIHCDVKADNIVLHLTESGEPRLWLIDFGDARILDEPSSWWTQGPGAPEIHCWPDNESGRYSSRTDSWCLAQCAACLWAGGLHAVSNPAWMPTDMPLKTELEACLAWDPLSRLEASDIARAAHAALEARGVDASTELKRLHSSL